MCCFPVCDTLEVFFGDFIKAVFTCLRNTLIGPRHFKQFLPALALRVIPILHLHPARFAVTKSGLPSPLKSPNTTPGDLATRRPNWSEIEHQRRRVLHCGVTERPTSEWTAQQMAEAFSERDAKQYLIRDRDAIYGHAFRCRINSLAMKECYGASESLAECLRGKADRLDSS
jgi:hypothetical protein